MASLKQCINGHFFDSNIYPNGCPYCDPEYNLPSKYSSLGRIKRIGSGTVGTVYKIDGAKSYALKVISCGTDSNKLQNTMNELAVIQRLQHTKAAICVFDSFVQNENEERTVYILEELLQPLTDVISSEEITAKQL